MTIVESLQLERSKNPNEIILFKEGSWWRAYEESAFICHNFSKQLKEDEKYNLIKESLDPYDKNLIVTPKDIDETIENLSIIISEGLNRSLHPGRITK